MFTEDQLKRLLDNAIPGTEFYQVISFHLDSVRNTPRCPCCSQTENLTRGPSASGGWLYLCQDAAREALDPKR